MNRVFFVESMRSQGMRMLAASAVHERLLLTSPRATALRTELVVDVLRVTLRMWWPWLLVPFSAPVVWLLAWREIRATLERLQVPMGRVKVSVGYRKKRPQR